MSIVPGPPGSRIGSTGEMLLSLPTISRACGGYGSWIAVRQELARTPGASSKAADSAAWVNHYKDSQWKDVWSLFSSSICNQARGYFNIDPKKKELLDMARDTAPAKTNLFRNNVSIKVAQGESMFVEYGKDFKLTDAGLAEVRKTIPDFKNIDTADIGLQSYKDNGVTRYVGGRVPSASNPRINGVLSKGNYAILRAFPRLYGTSAIAKTAPTRRFQEKKARTC